MANNVDQNPLVIDSTGIVLNNNGGQQLYIKEMIWTGGAGGTLGLSINGSPTFTWTAPAASDLGSLNSIPIGPVQQLNVIAITGLLVITG